MPVVNLRDLAGDISEPALARRGIVRIDRATRWGNPFKLGPNLSRDAAVERYRRHLWHRIRTGSIALEDLAGLDQATVACHCAPRKCHGDVLLRAARWAAGELDRKRSGNR